MNRRSFVVVNALLAASSLLPLACSKEAAESPVGRYEIDRDALWAEWEPDIARNNPDVLDAMRSNVATMQFDLDLAPDGAMNMLSKMSAEGLPEGTETAIESSGTWKAEGETITLSITRSRGAAVTGKVGGTLRDGVLRLTLGPGKTIVLKRRSF